jgi:hypothetical protein
MAGYQFFRRLVTFFVTEISGVRRFLFWGKHRVTADTL